jgi:GT2 family glycosyltransferase
VRVSGRRFDVIVPTWRRPEQLRRCASALIAQRLLPVRVLVVAKVDDVPTHGVVAELRSKSTSPTIEMIVVPADGSFLTKLVAGLTATVEPYVAFTDDDAEPRPNWLERMAPYFDVVGVGGVGGRDWQMHERWDEKTVGTVSWFGRIVGNHHLGAGPARNVDILKGVNWAFRGEVIRRIGFDPRLRGRRNVTHTELALCLRLRREGWRLIYDPAIAVDHHVAPRQDGDVNARGGFEANSFADAVHNETLALLDYLPPARRMAFLAWAAAVGTGAEPGVAQVGRLLARGRTAHLWQRWLATVRGRLDGIKTFRDTRVPPTEGSR